MWLGCSAYPNPDKRSKRSKEYQADQVGGGGAYIKVREHDVNAGQRRNP